MKPLTSTSLIIFHPLKGSIPMKTFKMFRLPVPFMVGELWALMCVSYKDMDKPAKQAKMLMERLELKYSFQAQETY